MRPGWDCSRLIVRIRAGLFYELKSCSLGNLNFGNCAAGSYVFSDVNGLPALANTSAVAEFNYGEDDSIAMFMLSRGVAFADALRDKLTVYRVLIGDPTLRLRRSVPKSRAKLEVSQTVLDQLRLVGM